MLRTLFFVIIGLSAHAQVGFVQGHEFSAETLAGQIQIRCLQDDRQTVLVSSYQCQESELYPTDYDYFQADSWINADQVELKVTRADGSTRTKSLSFNVNTQRSETKFNLWKNSLLQSALLNFETNKIHYKLKLKGQVQREGDFSVNVKSTRFIQCTLAKYYSENRADCRQPYTYCQRYFSENYSCN